MEHNSRTSTSSQGDTPVSPSAQLEIEKRRLIQGTSGQKCYELLETSDPLGSFVKMFLGMSNWDLTKCSPTWLTKATPFGHLLFQLMPRDYPTTETGCILWPTPQAMDAMKARPSAAMVKHMNGPRKGRTKIGTMKDAAVYGLLWTGEATRQGEGELNPQRLEWMMGYPIGWTEIKD